SSAITVPWFDSPNVLHLLRSRDGVDKFLNAVWVPPQVCMNDACLIVTEFRSDVLRDVRQIVLVCQCDEKFAAGPVIVIAVEERVNDAAQILLNYSIMHHLRPPHSYLSLPFPAALSHTSHFVVQIAGVSPNTTPKLAAMAPPCSQAARSFSS